MSNIEKLGFDNWFMDKVDLSKTDFNIVRVISVNKNSPRNLSVLLWAKTTLI